MKSFGGRPALVRWWVSFPEAPCPGHAGDTENAKDKPRTVKRPYVITSGSPSISPYGKHERFDQ